MSSDTAAAARAIGDPQRPSGRRSRRRSSSTRDQRIALAVVLGIGIAVAIALCDTAPTGTPIVDGLYRSAAMAVTVLAASRARRRVLLVAAALVSVGSDGWMLVPAAAALVLSFVLAWTDRRDRVAGGVAGLLIAWAALDLSWPASPVGATTALAAVALLPLWYSGYRVARRRTRRTIRIVAAGALGIVVLGSAVGALVALTQRSTLKDAADATVAAAGALTSGGDDGSVETFRSSQEQFQSVADAAGSWWAAPAKLVPVVAQNVQAVQTAAASGADLNGVAAELAAQVDYDALAGEDGSIDVGRLAGYAPAAQRAADAVGSARTELTAVRSPWLAPPVADQLDTFVTQVEDAVGATELAAAAARELPAILGADGPRRYLLLLGSPSEARDLGGHIGNWAELTATDGRLDVVRVGEPYDLYGPASPGRPQLSPSLDLPASLLEADPTRFPQNWGSSPDLATVGRLVADLYPQVAGGAPLDGVLYADPTAFAALLELTGPVEADGITLSAENAVEFLTRQQFEPTPDQQTGTPGGDERSLTPLVRTALESFTDSQLPGPTELARVFGGVIADGHLQFVTTQTPDDGLLRRAGLDQPVAPPDGGDLLAVVNRNANPSKIDAFLHRTIDYFVSWNPASGTTRSRVVVTLRNDAPASGLSGLVLGSSIQVPEGTNRTELSVLSPFDAVGAMVDGRPAAFGTRDDIHGLRRYALVVDLPPGGERTVIFDLEGAVRPGPEYVVRWFNQPLPNPDRSRVILRASPGDSAAVGEEVGHRRIETLVLRPPGGGT